MDQWNNDPNDHFDDDDGDHHHHRYSITLSIALYALMAMAS